MIPVSVDSLVFCEFDYPVWGNRPTSPTGVYTDNGDGTVSDSQTKLVWQQAVQYPVTWPAAQSYCDALVLGGKNDWRLPTMAESQSIVDYSKTLPAADATKFPNNGGELWTAVPRPAGAKYGDAGGDYWSDQFGDGSMSFRTPTYTATGAQCVRGGLPVSAELINRFTVTATDVVLDNATGLTWQQTSPGSYNWTNAQTYCSTLSLSGTGWRLPSVRELSSLLDRSSTTNWIDATAFPGSAVAEFWTNAPNGVSSANVVDFSLGKINFDTRTTAVPIRCVR